ncbi:MAG: DNA primase small subunit domain-containing protein [Thermoproteota archaeon]
MVRRMLQASLEFLKREFFKYYYENISRLVPPEPIRSREFGFFLEKGRGMFRHKCFNSLKDFHEFILNAIPLDIYVSAANYEDPGNRDMSEKKLVNAELFFDIDAESVAAVSEEESAWICQKCGQYGIGLIDRCSSCNSPTELVRLVSEKQLKEALRETEKLIHVLTEDFGIAPENIHVFYSGNRGYHVHVNQEDFLNITGEGRREIVDYLLIQGLDEKELLNFLKKGANIEGVNLKGVKRRVYMRILEKAGSMEKLKASGRETVLKTLVNAVEELKVRIDPVVTIDMHRLMRMPESINSSSGMVKRRIRLEDLPSFKPLEEAIAFGDEEACLKVKIVPRFSLGGKTFGPFKDEEVELPAYAAVYIVCKGLGEYAGR